MASTSSGTLNTRQSQVAPKPVVDLPALESASRVLQDQFAKDAQAIPDLAETLTTRECLSRLIMLTGSQKIGSSGRAIVCFVYCVSGRLPCTIFQAKTYKHTRGALAALQ